jgi:hypothetical protein
VDELNSGLEDIKEIRSMMERASRFLSLSGLSGVSAGIVALLGALAAHWYLTSHGLATGDRAARDFLIVNGAVVLLVGASLTIFFSYRLAVRRNVPFWSPVARNVLESLLIPLAAGGILSAILISRDLMPLVPGVTLLFYGLALCAASRYTLRDLFRLGFLQIIIGLLASGLPQASVLLWGLGFGVLHIAYGLGMYRKYER